LGVLNLIKAVRKTPSIERCLFTSSQLVCRVGYIPENETDYCPPNPYGESKVLTERIVREEGGGGVTWCLFRPTTIWGAGMNAHYASFFSHLLRGCYFHMGKGSLNKSYGFVGNTAFQIAQFAQVPGEAIHGKVFFLADYSPLSLRDWINGIAAGLGRPTPHTFPLGLCRMLARLGDAFQNSRMERLYPLNTFRLNNILTEYQYDLHATQQICGDLPYGFDAGLNELVAWIKGSLINPKATPSSKV
jgi:nucleoside-diphosphate-sugar epimerase